MIKRPMLAAAASNEDLDRLVYPLYVSAKLDGIRCYCDVDLGPVTRSLKPIANLFIRGVLSNYQYVGLDGEIMYPGGFGKVQSAVMTHDGQPEIEFHTFDQFFTNCPNVNFTTRYDIMLVNFRYDPTIHVLEQVLVKDADEARGLAAEHIADGHEGIVLRDPESLYKQGRSTIKQQGMIKYKEFNDAEGIIIGFEELLRNNNPDERDKLGLAKRSDKKEGMVPGNTLGALILSTDWGDLRIGTGFDAALRDNIWRTKGAHMGKVVTFKYQTHGMQDLPRFPVFLHFRED